MWKAYPFLTAVVVPLMSLVAGDQVPAKGFGGIVSVPGRRVEGTLPGGAPLWYRDLPAWLKKRPEVTGSVFIGRGEGRNKADALRKAHAAALATARVSRAERNRLRRSDEYVVRRTDDACTMAGLYELSPPREVDDLIGRLRSRVRTVRDGKRNFRIALWPEGRRRV